jgi:hypothetical protein
MQSEDVNSPPMDTDIQWNIIQTHTHTQRLTYATLRMNLQMKEAKHKEGHILSDSIYMKYPEQANL